MVERLREIGRRLASGIIPRGAAQDVVLAADEVERLRDENVRLQSELLAATHADENTTVFDEDEWLSKLNTDHI